MVVFMLAETVGRPGRPGSERWLRCGRGGSSRESRDPLFVESQIQSKWWFQRRSLIGWETKRRLSKYWETWMVS